MGPIIVQLANLILPEYFKYRAEARERGEVVKGINSTQMIEMDRATSQEVVSLTDKYRAEWEAEG